MNFKLLTLAIFSVLAVSNLSAAKTEISPLEVADPDYPGASFDTKEEMQKKVNIVKDVQLTKQQQDDLKATILSQNRALASPYSDVPTPVTRSMNIKFTPGLTPPIVRLSANMLTTIVFTDSQGNPWNIQNVSLNRNLFSLGGDAETANTNNGSNKQSSNSDSKLSNQLHNILSLEPLNPIAYGNIAITLEGLETPIVLMLSTGQKEVDMRVDARISGLNPNRQNKGRFGAKFGTNIGGSDSENAYIVPNSTSSNSTVTQIDDMTLLFVDGTPPKDAEPLKSSDNSTEAWNFDNEVVVRTDKTVIYPSYTSAVTSASGVTVYRFINGTQNITFSGLNGKPTTVFLDQQ